MLNRFLLLWSIAAVLSGNGLLRAAEPPPAVDFARDVYPILQRACFECHGPQRQESDLRLDLREPALAGGASGAVIAPGKPDESELLRRIGLPPGDDEIMPTRGKPLSRRQIETIRAWIAAGAVWPEKLEHARHWAYVPPVRPARARRERSELAAQRY